MVCRSYAVCYQQYILTVYSEPYGRTHEYLVPYAHEPPMHYAICGLAYELYQLLVVYSEYSENLLCFVFYTPKCEKFTVPCTKKRTSRLLMIHCEYNTVCVYEYNTEPKHNSERGVGTIVLCTCSVMCYEYLHVVDAPIPELLQYSSSQYTALAFRVHPLKALQVQQKYCIIPRTIIRVLVRSKFIVGRYRSRTKNVLQLNSCCGIDYGTSVKVAQLLRKTCSMSLCHMFFPLCRVRYVILRVLYSPTAASQHGSWSLLRVQVLWVGKHEERAFFALLRSHDQPYFSFYPIEKCVLRTEVQVQYDGTSGAVMLGVNMTSVLYVPGIVVCAVYSSYTPTTGT